MAHLQDNQIGLVVAYVILNLAGLTAVGLRFYAIAMSGRSIAIHDILCVIALVMLIAYSIDTLIGTVHGGIGLAVSQVTQSQLAIAFKTIFVAQFFSALSAASYRLAILHLHMQVFATPLSCHLTWVCVMVVVFFFVASITTTASICWPGQYTWDEIIQGACGNQDEARLIVAAFDTVLDVLAVFMPLLWASRREMTQKQKIHVAVTFALVLSIFGIDLSRILKLQNCRLSSDFTRCGLQDVVLADAEMAIGIIIACVPTLGPVFYHYLSRNPDHAYSESASSRRSSIKPIVKYVNGRRRSSTNNSLYSFFPRKDSTTKTATEATTYSMYGGSRYGWRRNSEAATRPQPQPQSQPSPPAKAHIHKRKISYPMPVRPVLLETHKSFDASLYQQLDAMDYRIEEVQEIDHRGVVFNLPYRY